MPVKGQAKRSSKDIEIAVKRYLSGESVTVLSKYYGISRPQVYNWINAYKEQTLRLSKQRNMGAEDIEASNKQELQIEVNALRAQVRKLREQLFEIMVNSGKL